MKGFNHSKILFLKLKEKLNIFHYITFTNLLIIFLLYKKNLAILVYGYIFYIFKLILNFFQLPIIYIAMDTSKYWQTKVFFYSRIAVIQICFLGCTAWTLYGSSGYRNPIGCVYPADQTNCYPGIYLFSFWQLLDILMIKQMFC